MGWSGARARVRGEEQSGDNKPGAAGVGLRLAVILRRPCDATVTWFARVPGPGPLPPCASHTNRYMLAKL